MSIISIKSCNITNGEDTVVSNLHMEVQQGDFVFIVGKVGSGKTSIIRTMIAENRPAGGECTVCGYDMNGIREKDIPFLRRKMGIIFQDFQLLQDMDVEENLLFVLKATGWKDRAEMDARIDEVLHAVDMGTKSHRMPHQLSGGEQQRVAIARSLLNRPELILADEPTGNLDPETADGIMQLLRRINREGTAVVMVTHNRSLLDKYPGRVFFCGHGSCKEI